MKLEEIKQLLKISGGKLVLSDGELEESFVVLRLDDYLRERGEDDNLQGKDEHQEGDKSEFFNSDEIFDVIEKDKTDSEKRKNLTDEELLDKINSDIEELRKRKQEDEIESILESDVFGGTNQGGEELNYEKI